jgi:hypothetical protein
MKEPKQETLEEAAGILSKRPNVKDFDLRPYGYIGALLNYIKLLEEYTKWEQEQDKNKYSEEEVLRIITSCKEYLSFGDEFNEKQWFEQYKKK